MSNLDCACDGRNKCDAHLFGLPFGRPKPLSRNSKAYALVDAGLAGSIREAYEMLEDMGE